MSHRERILPHWALCIDNFILITVILVLLFLEFLVTKPSVIFQKGLRKFPISLNGPLDFIIQLKTTTKYFFILPIIFAVCFRV
jgi:hypothetical protein